MKKIFMVLLIFCFGIAVGVKRPIGGDIAGASLSAPPEKRTAQGDNQELANLLSRINNTGKTIRLIFNGFKENEDAQENLHGTINDFNVILGQLKLMLAALDESLLHYDENPRIINVTMDRMGNAVNANLFELKKYMDGFNPDHIPDEMQRDFNLLKNKARRIMVKRGRLEQKHKLLKQR